MDPMLESRCCPVDLSFPSDFEFDRRDRSELSGTADQKATVDLEDPSDP